MNGAPTWLSAPAEIAIATGEVHIWRAALDLSGDTAQVAGRTLSPAEHARATRFRFERDRTRYIAAHAALRAILARYLDMYPQRIPLEQAAGGKPYVAAAANLRHVQFSMAGCQDLALYAVALAVDVGVDVEMIRPIPEAGRIAARFFSAAEAGTLQALPENQRLHAFYTCWTIKEAYTKAIGAGLAYPLDRVEVAISEKRLAAIDGDAGQAGHWLSTAFSPQPGYTAALVARYPAARLAFWQYHSRL